MYTITNDPGDITNPIADKPVQVIETATNALICETIWLKFPKSPTGELALDMYIPDVNPVQSQRLHLLCDIDRLDKDLDAIYVTLNTVFVNDELQYPPAVPEPAPPVLPLPEPAPPNLPDAPPSIQE